MTNKRQKTVRISLLAMFAAIIFAMTFTPYIGYITIPGMLSITTIHIIVIIAAITMDNFLDGAILGGVWGISCLLYALYNGTADAAIFLDPRISVVPRILVGILIVAFYKLAKLAVKITFLRIVFQIVTVATLGVLSSYLAFNLSNKIKLAIAIGIIAISFCTFLFIKFGKNDNSMPMFVASLCGTFSNTVLVLTAINLFATDGLFNLTGTVKNIFNTVIALNGSIEIVVAVVITVPCCIATTSSLKKLK